MLDTPSFIDKLFTEEPISELNYGELCCLSLAKDGLNAQETAKVTGYQTQTVNSYLKSARDKLNAKKTIDAAFKAVSLGWIS